MRIPTIAIVGRPNVGKSTLFNRIVSSRYAIVDNEEGVTRDRNILLTKWNGKDFFLIDTGGYNDNKDRISKEVVNQVMLAITESEIILFVVDVRAGITELDEKIARILRKEKASEKTFLVINKVDSSKIEYIESGVFHLLGFKNIANVSSANGDGVADLLDVVTKNFPLKIEEETRNEDRIRIAVIGRPNVGKSSFVNAVLGEERNIVTEIAGTTRDSIDSYFKRNKKEFVLIDTAGLRRRVKVPRHETIEFFSTARTIKAIERADVALVLIDATTGLDRQDLRIMDEVTHKKKGIVLCVNKWDLVEKDSKTADAMALDLKAELGTLSFVPIVFISAITKQRVFKAIDMANHIGEIRQKRISTNKLNNVLLPEITKSPPWSKSGKEIKIKYVSQLSTEPPLFGFFGSNTKLVTKGYERFLEGLIRKHFDFEGVVIELHFRLK